MNLEKLIEPFTISARRWREEADRYMKFHKEKILGYLQKASALQLEGKHNDALLLFHKVLEQRPFPEDRYVALVNSGNSYFYLNRPTDAERMYQQAISLDSSNSLAWTNLGTLLTSRGDLSKDHKFLSKAAEKLKEAIKLNPMDPNLYLTQGITFYHLRKYRDAMKCFRHALKLDNNTNSDLLTLLGVVCNDGYNDWRKAKDYFSDSLKIDPDSIFTKINHGGVVPSRSI